MKRYEVNFYTDKNGNSQIIDWIRELDSSSSKEKKTLLKKLYYQIERLEHDGTFVGAPIVKQIEGKLWELRPVPHRVFFAVLEENQILLLHHFRKKTKKTPIREIEQAKREWADWIERNKG